MPIALILIALISVAGCSGNTLEETDSVKRLAQSVQAQAQEREEDAKKKSLPCR